MPQFPETIGIHADPTGIPFGPADYVHSVRRLTDERDDAFNAVFIDQSNARRAAKETARAKRKPRRIDPDESFHAANYRNLHQQTRRRIAARLGEGLLTEREGSASLRRILQILPKRVWCGNDKKAVRKDRKLFALDKPYVTADKRRLGVIPIDLDRTFKSEHDLKERLEKILPADLMPNHVVGTILPSTSLVRPHLLFLLPPGWEVWGNNPQAVEFYHSIHRRLIRALLPLGADPAQLANPYKFKNPLSPKWDTVILSEKWNKLADFHKLLPHDVSEGQLRREAAEHAGLFDLKGSMGYWNTIGRLCTKTLTDARKRRDQAYMTATDLASWLRQAVTDIVTDRLGVPTDKERDIIARRTEYSARRWRINYSACSRGRDAAEIARVACGVKIDPKACRQVAQRVTGEERHAALVETVARAIMEVTPQGSDPYVHRPAVVNKVQGLVSRSGTYNVFDEAVIRFQELSIGVHRYIEAETSDDLTSPSVDDQPDRLSAFTLPILSDIRILVEADNRILVAATHEPLRECVAPRSQSFIGDLENLDTCCLSSDPGCHENQSGNRTPARSPGLEPLLRHQATPARDSFTPGRCGSDHAGSHDDSAELESCKGNPEAGRHRSPIRTKPRWNRPLYQIRDISPMGAPALRIRDLIVAADGIILRAQPTQTKD